MSASDLCAALAALQMGSRSLTTCHPAWHGRPRDHWKRSDGREHKFYLLLGGSDVSTAQLGVYTDWMTIKPIVKDGNEDWRDIVLLANHGRAWTYAAALAYWQQDCGQGHAGHRCIDPTAMPPRYSTPTPASIPRSPPAPTSNSSTGVPFSSSSSNPARDGGTAVLRFIVIDGDTEVYTDEGRVEAEVERRLVLGQRPHVLRFTTLADALSATSSPSPTRQRR